MKENVLSFDTLKPNRILKWPNQNVENKKEDFGAAIF